MNERIKQLRKALGLTLEKFGERIGVSRSAMGNIENGVRGVTDQMFKSICREFNVNENWLRTGEGEMFAPVLTFNLDEFAKAQGATDLEIELIKAYFELDADIRDVIVDHFKKKFGKVSSAAPSTSSASSPVNAPDISAAEADYEKSLGIAPSTSSTASNTIKDTENAG